MAKLIAFIVIIVFVASVWFGVMWCLWSLWGWVLPQLYANGSHNLVAPSFWLFAGCWTLMAMVGRALFGGGSK
jgi:hypothetical protein